MNNMADLEKKIEVMPYGTEERIRE